MFIVNDKGTSWAYATPGFPQSLNPELLKELRVLAQVPEQAKIITEVRSIQAVLGSRPKCASTPLVVADHGDILQTWATKLT